MKKTYDLMEVSCGFLKLSMFTVALSVALLTLGFIIKTYITAQESNNRESMCISESTVTPSETPLYALAELKMNDLLSTNAWSHINSDGVTLEQRRLQVGYNNQVGEVLAKGCFTIDAVVNAWLKSPTHKDVITDKSFTKAVILIDRNDTTCYVVGEYSK